MKGNGGENLRETLYGSGGGALRKYMRLSVGEGGLRALLGYELRILLFENVPGALGIALRRLFYRSMLGGAGRGIILGKGLTVRHPSKIFLGDNVAVDDYCSLDARGGPDARIEIGGGTVISRGSILRTKNGRITLGPGGSIGSHCILSSISSLEIGPNLLMASSCFVTAGGGHAFDRLDVPVAAQGMVSRGGVVIGENVWIGAHAVILDGVRIGDNAVIGACALVNRDIPACAVAYGIPARPVRDRRDNPAG
ncbi:MAG: acyltransferase [bacterium]|nr:acyltransferase [bacterium]